MFLEFAALVVGLAVLIKSSEVSINKSVALARLSGLGSMTVGFVLLAVMTSLPELAVTVVSAMQGSDLSIGMLFGSNIADIALVAGIAASLYAFRIDRKIKSEINRALLVTSAAGLVVLFLGGVNFLIGIFLLIMFFSLAKSLVEEDVMKGEKKRKISVTWAMTRTLAVFCASIVFVLVSAYVVTSSSISIAEAFGVSESVIGATIVAVGTSLPELSVTLQALRKKEISLAIGNITGSLVANVTLILGIAGLLATYTFGATDMFLVIAMVVTNLLFYFLAKNGRFGHANGIALLILYVVYVAFLTVSL